MVNSLKENAEIQTCSLDQLAQIDDGSLINFSDETSEKATNESESSESPEQNPESTIDQELTLKINKQLQNFLGNLKRLEIDTSKVPTRSDWGEIINDIKSPADLQKISEDTIQNYLSLSDQVPQEHYYYIAENFKQILYTHLTYNPRRKGQLTGGYATGMRLDGIVGNDNYTTKTLKTLQKIEKKSESEQRNYVIKHLDDPALVDFWLKSKLSKLKGGGKDDKNEQNQEKSEKDLFIESFFKEIPFEKLDAYFKSAEKSSFLKSLGEILLHCQAEKEGLIIKTDKFVLLDVFDLKSNLKCQKLADYSEKIGGNDQEYSFLTMMKATLEMRKMFKVLGTNENGVPFIDKKILTTKEGLKVLSEFLNAQNTLPQEIEKIKNYYRNLTFEVTKQYGGGQAVQGFMRAQEKEINTAKLNFEKSYVKLLLKSGHKPTGIIQGVTGLKLDFSKGNNVDDIVRDSFTEHVEDGRDKFLDDLKNDKQNAFGAIGGLIGGTIGTGVMAALTQGSNPWLMSAGYTVGSRLGNGVVQEARNAGEQIFQRCGADIKDNEAGVGVVDKNGVQDFGLSFLRGIGWLDNDYQAVGGTNFLIDLGFDYLSGVASFGLSNKVFGGEVTGFLKNTTKEIVQEFTFENMIFDNPAEILKEGTKSFLHTLGHENNPGALTVMINTADELYSVENLTTTFLHTVSSCGALGAMHRPLNYVNSRLTTPIIKAKLPGMEEQIDNEVAGLFKAIKENGRQMKNQELLDIKTKQPIDQNSQAFKDFQAKLKAVNELQNQYLELTKEFNDEMKKKMKNPDDPDGVKLKYGLISPFDTPMHILKAKMEIAKKELENAKKEGDLEKVKQYENLLQEYEHAKEVLERTYFDGTKKTKYDIKTEDAINNSTKMDGICLEENSDQRNSQLLTLIDEQYQKLPLEQKTQIEFSFTNEQLQAIIKAHMKEGELGNLSRDQLIAKRNILAEAGLSDNQIRFLLEAGFCGGLKAEYQDNSILNHSIQHQAFMWNRDLVQFDFDNILKVECGAFRHCSNLSNITNFHNISKIEDRSFSDTGLQEVHFGNKLEEIGEECFFGCKKLEKVSFYVGAPVREIKQRTFMCCESLKTIDLPKNISIIGNQAFLDCTSLTHLEITNPYCYLGYDVFKGCKNLKSITIPELYKGKEEDLGIPNNCNITYLPINQEIKQYISNINEHIKIKLIRFLRNIYQNTNFNNDIDKILKLTTFNGEINEDALELLIKLSNENWALDNDTYIFILQQGKGKYKEIINILDDIKYSIQINKFRIYNGTLFLDLTQFDDNEITTLRYGKIKLNNCKEYYGSENNIFNDKLHGFCTIEELLHMYTMNHCKYLDFFKESCQKNIVTDFRYSHGLRNVTDKQRGNNIYNLILQSIQYIPTEAERHALEAYKGDASYEINTQSSDRIQEGRDIENLCNKNTLKESLTVYRVEGYGGLLKKLRFSNGLTLEEAIRDQERYSQELSNVSSFIGNKLTNNFFVSTTVNAGIEGDVFVGKPIKRELNVQPGVGAYFLDLVGINPEGEVLLNRNLQYTIESIEIGYPTIIKAKVENIDH